MTETELRSLIKSGPRGGFLFWGEEDYLKKHYLAQIRQAVLAMPGLQAPGYERVCRLADEIARAVGDGPCYVALEQDMAKALGAALRLRLGEERPILCLDGLQLSEGSYLDVGAPVGPALPVVIKTLVLETEPK